VRDHRTYQEELQAWLTDPALYAGGPVDASPEQVGVAVVSGVLVDHVDMDPAEADVLLHEAA